MAQARFGDRVASGLRAVTHDPADLTSGFWAVVLTFEGHLTALRFEHVRAARPEAADDPHAGTAGWPGLEGEWRTSLGEAAYRRGVVEVRRRIAAGTVYQVNLCRVLTQDLPADARVGDLGRHLARHHRAPYAATIDAPEVGVEVASASPEAFLLRHGRTVTTRPIKGTATHTAALLPKDHAENVMIVDLVRHDLQQVCRPGTVRVDHLCRPEAHPGLVHLVSEVTGTLRPEATWAELLGATFPPGSVTGAPKHTALRSIAELEPVPRGPYCGAVGWLDADRAEAVLAVGIRTFWAEVEDGRRVLRFGTGAGITWGSEPGAEWRETELKAERLTALAAAANSPGRATAGARRRVRGLAHG